MKMRMMTSSSVESVEFIGSQNRITAKWMNRVKRRYYDVLRNEMLESSMREEEDIIERINGYEYYQRMDEGDELYKYCRRDPESQETCVILDPNEMLRRSSTSQSLAIGNLAISTDHRYLAYCADFNGGVNWSLYVKDVDRDEIVRVIRDVETVEWSSDEEEYVMYYTKKNRGDIAASKIYRRKLSLNHDESEDHEKLLLEMKSESSRKKFFADLKSTKDGSYILAYFNSKTRTVLYAISKSAVDAEPLRVWSSVDDDEDNIGQCFAEHNDNVWYLLTRDQESENLSLSRVSHSDVCQGQIVRDVVVPNRSDVVIEDMDMFRDFCVLYERKVDGGAHVSVLDMKNDEPPMEVDSLPSETYVIRPAPNADFLASQIRFTCSGPSLPPTLCTYSFSSGMVSFDELSSSDYVTYREYVPSKDGTLVPITITHHKDLKRDGSNPTLLTGYGAYGIPFEIDHCVGRSTLLNRGWVVAIAHVRGGGDLGT